MCDGLWQNEIVRAGKNSGPVLSRLWTQSSWNFGQRRRPSVLSNSLAALPDCLCHSLFGRYWPLSLESSEKRTNVKVFGPHFSGGTTPIVLRQIVSATYSPPFVKVWFADLRLRSPEMKQNSKFTGVGKNGGRVWSCLWTKVHDILRRCRRPLVVWKALDRLFISPFVPRT